MSPNSRALILSHCLYICLFRSFHSRRIYIVGLRTDLLPSRHNITKGTGNAESADSTALDDLARYRFPALPALARPIGSSLAPQRALQPRHIVPLPRWRALTARSPFVTTPAWKLSRPAEPAGTLVTGYRRSYAFSAQLVPLDKESVTEMTPAARDALQLTVGSQSQVQLVETQS